MPPWTIQRGSQLSRRNFTSGVQVFRCWYTVPEKLNGYETRDASLKVAFELEGDGMTMLSVYANNTSIYRGSSDTLEPILLTSKAQPGERFLVAMRMEVGDQPRKLRVVKFCFRLLPAVQILNCCEWRFCRCSQSSTPIQSSTTARIRFGGQGH